MGIVVIGLISINGRRYGTVKFNPFQKFFLIVFNLGYKVLFVLY